MPGRAAPCASAHSSPRCWCRCRCWPAKSAAMEALWETQKGAPLVLFAVPDEDKRTNRFAVEVPKGAALILTHRIEGELRGIDAFKDHPPVAPVFFAFRVMVGMGVLMLLLSWGSVF